MMELLKPFWLQILKYGAVFTGVLLVLFKARQGGKQSAENAQSKEILRGAQERAKVENTINSASDAEYNGLYNKWSK